MDPVLSWLLTRATTVLAVGVFLGLVLPDVAALMRPLLTACVFALLVMAMVRIPWPAVAAALKGRWTLCLLVLWLLVASPVLMALAVGGRPLSPSLGAALVLMAASAPIMSSPALATLIGLDGAHALVVMTAATLLVPLSLPFLAVAGLDLPLAVAPVDLFLSLAGLVGGALAIAGTVRTLAGEQRLARLTRLLDAGALLCLLVFAVAIMDGVSARLMADWRHVALVGGLAVAGHVGLLTAGALAFLALGRRRALTAGFLSANRNMALLLAVLPAGADPDLILFFAVGQVPIYVMPAVLRPLYRRLLA